MLEKKENEADNGETDWECEIVGEGFTLSDKSLYAYFRGKRSKRWINAHFPKSNIPDSQCNVRPMHVLPSPYPPAMTWHFTPRHRALYKMGKVCHLVLILCIAGLSLLCMTTVHSYTNSHTHTYTANTHDVMQQTLLTELSSKVRHPNSSK